jgi:uncharacterized protein
MDAAHSASARYRWPMSTLIVFATAPVSGLRNTRLSPPCTAPEAVLVAEATLRDTIDVAMSSSADRLVLVLDGPTPPWFPEHIEVIAQRGDELDERVANAFFDVIGGAIERTLLIGCFTPQISVDWLRGGFVALESGAQAVLGLTDGGGFWALGLQQANRNVFEGVPMNTPNTGYAQRTRIESLGLRLAVLPDTYSVLGTDDLDRLGAEFPDLRTANLWRALRTHAAAS